MVFFNIRNHKNIFKEDKQTVFKGEEKLKTYK